MTAGAETEKGAPPVHAELLDSEADLDPQLEAWEDLAVAAGRPLCAPAWMLAWWRHAAPPGALLRTIVAREGNRVIGVAPYFAQVGRAGRCDYRLLGSGIGHRIGPLAEGGREAEVAAAFGPALYASRPRAHLITFEGLDQGSPWPGLLAQRVPKSVPKSLPLHPYLTTVKSAPTVSLAERGFEDWLASKSSNFRQQMRRMRRNLAQRGGVVRMSSSAREAEADIAALMRLHADRWAGRSGSAILESGIPHMLVDAARALIDEGRFRLWVVEVDGRPISAQLFLAAGGEIAYWNGGFDESYAKLKPAMVAILAAIEDGFARGDRRLDLGGGAEPYKLRLADGDDPLSWGGLMPLDRRYPLTRAQLLPQQMRRGTQRVLQFLPPKRQDQVKVLLKSVRKSGTG